MQKRVAYRSLAPKHKFFVVKSYNVYTLNVHFFELEAISKDMALEDAVKKLGFENSLKAEIVSTTMWKIHDYVLECFTQTEWNRLPESKRHYIPQTRDYENEDERYMPDFDEDSDFITTEQSDELIPSPSGIFDALLDFEPDEFDDCRE